MDICGVRREILAYPLRRGRRRASSVHAGSRYAAENRDYMIKRSIYSADALHLWTGIYVMNVISNERVITA